MHVPKGFFALPASLLILIARAPAPVASQELEWPHNLPAHVKYFPEDEVFVKRELSLQKKLQQQKAIGVRKMSSNPEEKFYLDYWTFEVDTEDHNFNLLANTSFPTLQPCTGLHSNTTSQKGTKHTPISFWNRATFNKRDFKCPTGTNACSSIGYPNSCCPTGETCQIVQDTGLGNVGCCPAGETCSGSISSCGTGQTACPNNPGGGCCIAGYACLDVGCVYTGTATVVVIPTPSSTFRASTTTLTITTIITPSYPSASPTTVTSTTIIVPVPTPVSTTQTTSTSIVVATSSATTITSTTHTTVNNALTCSTGYKSCPISLGGGCCPTNRACAAEYCPELSSTNTPNAPVRPTTDTTTTTAVSTTITGAGCPTGYYACSAYYQGGCCQVGRDCSKTNCPATASTTLVSGSGITIVAPTGSGISTQVLSGVCATGWQSCAPSNGGGCCPIGYACGASCTATASGGGGSVTGKEAPISSEGSKIVGLRAAWTMLFGVLIGAFLH